MPPGMLGVPLSIIVRDAGAGLLVLILSALPGIALYHRLVTPISWRRPEGLWLGGLPGLFVSQVIHLSALYFFNIPAGLWLLSLSGITVIAFLLPRKNFSSASAQSARPWTAGDWGLFALFAGILLFFTLPPLCRIGEVLPKGIVFRSYFYGDMLKHMGVTGALGTGEWPPPNPFLSGHRLHYYWLFYLFPRTALDLLKTGGSPIRVIAVQQTFFLLSFLLAFHSISRRMISSTKGRLVALFGLGLATSYEGVAVLIHSALDPETYGQWTDYNVDAFTRWRWLPLQVDTLYRSFLYTPPHQLCHGLTLTALWHFLWRGKSITCVRAVLIGTAAAGALAYNFFIGFAVIAALGLAGIISMLKKSDRLPCMLRIAAFTLPIILTGLLILWMEMAESAAGRFHFILGWRVCLLFVPIMLVNFGAYLPLGIIGLWTLHHKNRTSAATAMPGLHFITLLILTCFLLMSTIAFQENKGDVSLKLGQALNVQFALLAGAASTAPLKKFRKLYALIALVLILPALPTLFMDFYNSINVHHPRFRALFLHKDVAAAQWASQNLPRQSLVQALPTRDVHNAHLLPAFSQRPAGVTDRHHSVLYVGDGWDYFRRKEIIIRMFETLDYSDAFFIMRSLNIDALLVGKQEKDYFPLGTAKLSLLPWLYGESGVSWYAAQDKTVPMCRFTFFKKPSLQERTLAHQFLGDGQYIRPGEPEGRCALGTGWSIPERDDNHTSFSWMHGANSSIYLFGQKSELTLQLKTWSYLSDIEVPHEVDVFLKKPDELLFLGTLKVARNWDSYELKIPAGTLSDWCNEVVFVTGDDAFKNSDYFTGNDPRQLTLAVSEIKVFAGETPPQKPTGFAPYAKTKEYESASASDCVRLTSDGVASFSMRHAGGMTIELHPELKSEMHHDNLRHLLIVGRCGGELITFDHANILPMESTPPLLIQLPEDITELFFISGSLHPDDLIIVEIVFPNRNVSWIPAN